MASYYEIEIITGKGNYWVKGTFTHIIDARKRAVKEIGNKRDWDAIIHKRDGYSRTQVEHAFYDDYVDDFALHQYGNAKRNSRRYRVSPKTGKLLDFDKNWRYI